MCFLRYHISVELISLNIMFNVSIFNRIFILSILREKIDGDTTTGVEEFDKLVDDWGVISDEQILLQDVDALEKILFVILDTFNIFSWVFFKNPLLATTYDPVILFSWLSEPSNAGSRLLGPILFFN